MSQSRHSCSVTTPARPPYLGHPDPTPLATWSRDMVRTVALAYRTAHAQALGDVEAWEAARAAYVAAGGSPGVAKHDVPKIITAVVSRHAEWFWRPVQARIEREERYWRGRGIWPPPMNRAEWPEIS